MKTSLQELIHYIENKSELDKETLLNKAKSLLEKEKQDLIDAFSEGYKECERDDLNLPQYSDFEDYYNQTFKQ